MQGGRWYSGLVDGAGNDRALAKEPELGAGSHLLGTITTNEAGQSCIDDLLQNLAERRADGTIHTSEHPSLLTLLLTPTYAQHALDDRLPIRVLQSVLSDQHQNLTKPLEVLTAVVDRLPSDTDRQVGEEGLAYMYGPAAPELTSHETTFDSAAQKPGSLKFRLPTLEHRPWQYTIQLPLAQTIFSTGKSSTLVQTKYEHDAEKGLTKTESRFLESKTVHLPFEKLYGAVATMVPLIPLTAFRVVRNAMGNIVRLLSSATSADDIRPTGKWSDPQPASQELEAVVAAYFKALNMSPEPVNVWALIAPKVMGAWAEQKNEGSGTRTMRLWNPEEVRELWTTKDSTKQAGRIVNSAVLRLLRSGGRLHRVLSGGGGWGKKAGLLSLDPDMVYSSRELRGEKGWDFDFEGEGAEAVQKQQRQALGEIVREGESIMFFLAPRDTEQFDEGRSSAWSFINRADRAAIFGAIPSTIDMVPGETIAVDGNAPQPLIKHHQNLFGAYSEGGLAVDVVMNDPRLKHNEVRPATHTQTKFDVPYSHFRITEAADDAEQVAKNTKNAAYRKTRRSHEDASGRYDGPPEREGRASAKGVPVWRVRRIAPTSQKTFSYGERRGYSTHATERINVAKKKAMVSETAGE